MDAAAAMGIAAAAASRPEAGRTAFGAAALGFVFAVGRLDDAAFLTEALVLAAGFLAGAFAWRAAFFTGFRAAFLTFLAVFFVWLFFFTTIDSSLKPGIRRHPGSYNRGVVEG
ncbi:MAG TPA: hypothetical protein VMH79_14290 [Thermoanaerobaculia bacterium]|nr:hypothetical protein [Thermoanaerobaculia bacterium]